MPRQWCHDTIIDGDRRVVKWSYRVSTNALVIIKITGVIIEWHSRGQGFDSPWLHQFIAIKSKLLGECTRPLRSKDQWRAGGRVAPGRHRPRNGSASVRRAFAPRGDCRLFADFANKLYELVV